MAASQAHAQAQRSTRSEAHAYQLALRLVGVLLCALQALLHGLNLLLRWAKRTTGGRGRWSLCSRILATEDLELDAILLDIPDATQQQQQHAREWHASLRATTAEGGGGDALLELLSDGNPVRVLVVQRRVDGAVPV